MRATIKKLNLDKGDYFIMGQKVHPVGFRLGITTNHSSQWFAKVRKSNQYSHFLAEDIFIREFLFREATSLHHVIIQRKNTL